MYIQNKSFKNDFAYISEVIEENLNDKKYQVIWASTGSKELLFDYDIQMFIECNPLDKELELCRYCKIPLILKVSQNQQKFLACPSYKLNKLGRYYKYLTKIIYDERQTEVEKKKIKYWN